MACRDATRANEACAKIIAETNNTNIEVELIDLSRLKSIREFCDRINKKLKRLDVLINNAGWLRDKNSILNAVIKINLNIRYRAKLLHKNGGRF